MILGRRGLLLAAAGLLAPAQAEGRAPDAPFETSVPTMRAADAARAAGRLTSRPPHAALKALWQGGTWSATTSHGGSMLSQWKPGQYTDPKAVGENMLPLKPQPMARYKDIRREMGRGRQIFGPYAQCHPAGMPYALAIDFSGGYEAVVADDQISIFYGAERDLRRIYLDGRPPPDQQATRLYAGFSVAHWEGPTMVVETTNIRGDNTQIEPHAPKAEGSYILERYTPTGNDRQALEMTMRNPQFTRPWVVDMVFVKDPAGRLNEMLCSDDNRWVFRDGELVLTGPDGRVLEKAEP